jgi:hypothetical protein
MKHRENEYATLLYQVRNATQKFLLLFVQVCEIPSPLAGIGEAQHHDDAGQVGVLC